MNVSDHSKGFGGKYGVQQDRVDKSAKGWSEHSKPELHSSQTDHKKGFGGKFGVDTDRVDKSAKGWSEQSKPELHSSQTDHKKGFGGKYGVEADRQDKVRLQFTIVDIQLISTEVQTCYMVCFLDCQLHRSERLHMNTYNT